MRLNKSDPDISGHVSTPIPPSNLDTEIKFVNYSIPFAEIYFYAMLYILAKQNRVSISFI
jgi:hypothetical protein